MFESRVTRLNVWKGARVQRNARTGKERYATGHALACTGARGCSDTRSGAQTCAGRQALGTSRTYWEHACMHARREMLGRMGAGSRAVTSERARGESARKEHARAGDAERLGVRRVHFSPESTVMSRNHLFDLKRKLKYFKWINQVHQ
ncbi:hypothetical protein CRG98_022796 [Punica granatum]|uniref:Uncharacterized protein n=1 Tax=Punica granatum TaxID=22663 RepID=A0A2I0JKP7_PUNGR|nr:hypothetical protein CRG98_022796 [Punica granatum]